MRVHLDVLGWSYVLMGGMGLLTGAALAVLAAGTALVLGEGNPPLFNPVIWLLLLGSVALSSTGGLMVSAGRALVARRRGGRPAALLLAVPNLVVLPFGTALGIYTFWTLLNDDARREFGRRPRAPLSLP